MDFIKFANLNFMYMAKLIENNLGAVNLISPKTNVTGDIVTDSDIRIDGTLLGNMVTAGRLIIGPNGRIEGEIRCKTAEIEGNVKGKITVDELLSLKATSLFSGDIITGQIMIEPGAFFTGFCKMKKNQEE
jgi:cytoskeletal protein CcmA (bactofilin family)